MKSIIKCRPPGGLGEKKKREKCPAWTESKQPLSQRRQGAGVWGGEGLRGKQEAENSNTTGT